MAGFNEQTIIGYLGRDPEMKYTPQGSAVCTFSVAVSFKKKSGADETEWFNCEAWDKTAEIANQYLSKGKQVFIKGRTKTEQYEKDGQQKRYTKVVVGQLVLLGERGNGNASEAPESDPEMPF